MAKRLGFARGRTVQHNSGGGGGGNRNYFKPQEGQQKIRLLPFTHTIHQRDFELLRLAPGEAEVGDEVEDLFLHIRKHMHPEIKICGILIGIGGQVLGNCELCEQQQDLKKRNDPAASRWRAADKYCVNVWNFNSGQVEQWDAPTSLFKFFCEATESIKYQGEDLAGANGRDLIVKFNPQKHLPQNKRVPQDYYKFDWMDRSQCEAMDLSGLNIYDFMGSKWHAPEWAHDKWTEVVQAKEEVRPVPTESTTGDGKENVEQVQQPQQAVAVGGKQKLVQATEEQVDAAFPPKPARRKRKAKVEEPEPPKIKRYKKAELAEMKGKPVAFENGEEVSYGTYLGEGDKDDDGVQWHDVSVGNDVYEVKLAEFVKE